MANFIEIRVDRQTNSAHRSGRKLLIPLSAAGITIQTEIDKLADPTLSDIRVQLSHLEAQKEHPISLLSIAQIRVNEAKDNDFKARQDYKNYRSKHGHGESETAKLVYQALRKLGIPQRFTKAIMPGTTIRAVYIEVEKSLYSAKDVLQGTREITNQALKELDQKKEEVCREMATAERIWVFSNRIRVLAEALRIKDDKQRAALFKSFLRSVAGQQDTIDSLSQEFFQLAEKPYPKITTIRPTKVAILDSEKKNKNGTSSSQNGYAKTNGNNGQTELNGGKTYHLSRLELDTEDTRNRGWKRIKPETDEEFMGYIESQARKIGRRNPKKTEALRQIVAYLQTNPDGSATRVLNDKKLTLGAQSVQARSVRPSRVPGVFLPSREDPHLRVIYGIFNVCGEEVVVIDGIYGHHDDYDRDAGRKG